jgi:hypothetical protein
LWRVRGGFWLRIRAEKGIGAGGPWGGLRDWGRESVVDKMRNGEDGRHF